MALNDLIPNNFKFETSVNFFRNNSLKLKN